MIQKLVSVSGVFLLPKLAVDGSKHPLAKASCSPASTAFFLFAFLIICAGRAQAFTTEASYYTTKSSIAEGTSGILTASGEVFNENALMAASWDYPFNTRLKVSYGGKSIIVIINDRGPSKRLYKKGRRVDLSKAAFSALAPLSLGVITISAEVVK